ncbi:MAG: hypothetical protein MI861_09385, partial [Pirellulales bacterium]|nr:hypothetical protein [Pirellulales bacterium]
MSDSTENVNQPDETNPYDVQTPANPTSGVDHSDTQAGPRLWSPVIIIALMWGLIIIPGKIVPLTMIHFISMQFAPVLAGLGLLTWWLASKRVPWRQRWTGLGLVIATAVATLLFSHPSMFITMIVYGIPLALTLMIAGFLIASAKPWGVRRWIGYDVFAALLLVSLLFRIGEIDAAFSFTLVPRWAPTAEEEFLAELNEEPPAESGKIDAELMPQEAAASDWAEFRGPQRDGRLVGVTFATDWDNVQIDKPAFTGTRVLKDFPIADIRPYIDWSPFFMTW